MHLRRRPPEETGAGHRVEHPCSAQDVAVGAAEHGESDHAGGEVGAPASEERARRIGRDQGGCGDPGRAEHHQIGGIEREVERRDDGDRGERREWKVARRALHLAAHVAEGDPAVEREQRSDQRRSERGEARGGRRRMRSELGRRPGAGGEGQDHEPEHDRHLRERHHVLRDHAFAHPEDVDGGQRRDRADRHELRAARRERHEMSEVAGERDSHRGDGGGLDDGEQRPAVEESPERAEGAAQVDVEPSRLGQRRAQLGDGERAAQLGHSQPTRRASNRWKWCTPASRDGEYRPRS